MSEIIGPYIFSPDPDLPGWQRATPRDTGFFHDFLGEAQGVAEGPGKARMRFQVEQRHINIFGGGHGGYLMGLIDQALFLGPMLLGMPNIAGGVTIDVTVQFLSPVTGYRDVDIVVEVLRETGRMLFLRGMIEQDGQSLVAFTGTTKKGRPSA